MKISKAEIKWIVPLVLLILGIGLIIDYIKTKIITTEVTSLILGVILIIVSLYFYKHK